MSSSPRIHVPAGAWRAHNFTGLVFDDFDRSSAWLRERACLRLPPSEGIALLRLAGEYRPHPDARGIEARAPILECGVDGQLVRRLVNLEPGPFELELPVSAAAAQRGLEINLRLGGTGWTNVLAWAGRVTGLPALQRFRAQNKNRQIRIARLSTADGEVICDFSNRLAPFSMDYIRRHTRYQFNVVGFLTADLGVGESARCMVRAADAAGIATALVPLRLPCKNRRSDQTYAGRLQDTNPYRINVIHVDAPAARDIDHHHGASFRAGKYNIGYYAWELTEFPDSWMPSFAYFDEIWTPSEFARAAVAMKSPRPVLAMPHAISFPRPERRERARFGLPDEPFLFLFLYDLNSYSARKNPGAALAAFRLSGLAGKGAALVIKVQNADTNPDDFVALQDQVRSLPGTVLIDGTLSRADVFALEAACDCFVSLHRSEGFGLAVAESMYLGKPVISTDWSATAEYVNAANGCPVRCHLAPIEQSHGPYTKGQLWAEPDIEHAAHWMRRLQSEPALAARLGAAARATIEERFSPSVIGARYRQRLEAIATF